MTLPDFGSCAITFQVSSGVRYASVHSSFVKGKRISEFGRPLLEVLCNQGYHMAQSLRKPTGKPEIPVIGVTHHEEDPYLNCALIQR